MSQSNQPINGIPVIHPRAAGIDIGSRFHVVAVPPHLSHEPVQNFQAFTADLQRLAVWLQSIGIETVVMESTGVYWVSVFEVLESAGIDVMVANARETRSVPGRKSDIKMRNGCNDYMRAGYCVPVSARVVILQPYVPTFVIENACWIIPHLISSICRKRSLL